MSANFSVDNGDGAYLAGFLRGVATQIETPEYIGAAMSFAASHLKDRFSVAMDQFAAMNKTKFHHVYEWGDSYQSRYQNVGVPAARLWKLTTTGRGKNRNVGFTFLPSVREVPLHPQEEKLGVEARHTFTWKAPIMEFGMTVRIAPVEAARGKLVFFDERIGKIVIRSKPVTTVPGYKTGVQGSFTGYFLKWWGTDAQVVFENEVRPTLEKNIVPRGPGGRFMPGRSKAQSAALRSGTSSKGTSYDISINRANEQKGYANAVAAMKKVAAGYKQGAGGWENYRGSE